MLKKGDIILVLILVFGILLAVISRNDSDESRISWNNANDPGREEVLAIIKQDDRLIRTVNLSKLKKREVIRLPGQFNEFIVADQKKICFMSADCPDRLCVKAGWISKPGQLAVCLHNRAMIKIVKKGDKELEGITK
ncbi:NusG domain II-containing protein [Ruminiclostridium hungatei]|nr:NusG domain II-containing protein [Ruminiclostridium hungatei]